MTANCKKNHLNMLIQEVQKMKSTEIDFEYLRRKVRPYLHTAKTGKIYTLTLKGSSLSILFIPTDYCKDLRQYQFSVVSSKHQNKFLFTLHAKTNKEFLQKLIHKFQFFN